MKRPHPEIALSAFIGVLMSVLGGGAASGSMISVSGVTTARFGPAVNLTAAGSVDWLDLRTGNHKNATPRIAWAVVGGGSLPGTTSTWTDAAPTGTSGSDGSEFYAPYDFTHHVSFSHIITVTAPDTRPYLLMAYLGGFWNGGGFDTLSVTLPGATPYGEVWNDPSANGTGTDRNYAIAFQANNPGDVLTVTWQADAAGHDIAVGRAVALSAVPEPSTAALAGTAICVLCLGLRRPKRV